MEAYPQSILYHNYRQWWLPCEKNKKNRKHKKKKEEKKKKRKRREKGSFLSIHHLCTSASGYGNGLVRI
jgi:hypothetical protein